MEVVSGSFLCEGLRWTFVLSLASYIRLLYTRSINFKFGFKCEECSYRIRCHVGGNFWKCVYLVHDARSAGIVNQLIECVLWCETFLRLLSNCFGLRCTLAFVHSPNSFYCIYERLIRVQPCTVIEIFLS